MRVGIISDTHGLLRPEALAALKGSNLIIHAGDVGRADVLAALRNVAPTYAVRGNIDTQSWAAKLPETVVVQADGQHIFVVHNIAQLSVDPIAEGYHAVVFGHSHRPSAETRNGILFINPGSAGPRRFRLPVTVAMLEVSGRTLRPEIMRLG